MKKRLLLWCGLSLAALSYAQKKPLDHSVYDGWKRITNQTITPKGEVISYEIQPQEGDGNLIFRSTKNNHEINIPRGYNATITSDGRFAVCLIKPFYQATRKAKIKKLSTDKMPKDSIAIVSLVNGKIVKYGNVQSYLTAKSKIDKVAFICNDTTFISKSDRKKKDIGKPLLVHYFNTGKSDTIQYVDQFTFNSQGNTLAVISKKGKKAFALNLYVLPGLKLTTVDDKHRTYFLPKFDESGNKILFLASSDSLKENKKYELYSFEKGQDKAKLLIDKNYKTNLPQGWGLTEYSNPFFSKDGKRVFVGIAPAPLPKDTTIVPFETPALDLWHYADNQLPPMQLKNLQNELRKTYLAVYNEEQQTCTPLTTEYYDRIQLINGGNDVIALSKDQSKHLGEIQWDTQNSTDLSLVNTITGKRTFIGSGKFTNIMISPEGKYILWYELPEKQWFIYNIANRSTRCLTRNCGVNFWDEDNDMPQYPDPYGVAGWTKDDKDVLIYDRFDIWKFSTDRANAINITSGEGRRTKLAFRYISPKAIDDSRNRETSSGYYDSKTFIDPNETLLLDVFDYTTKKHGYATLKNGAKTKPVIAVLDGFTFSGLKKAENANIYIYQKSNFNTSPDLYVTSNLGKKENKISDINPQMRDYNWGTAELVKWNAYDNTPLEGLLYKPGNFDPTKKYPMIIYYYERKSNDLYQYYAPAPSQSIINISFYCSRGYLVFVPDIVYKTGTPGECAYNCIVSGAENLAKNAWVDKDNIGIQGQSWGGYQTAYLVTRTNMFKAAEAGAPVANMTSAYGGIRWDSGMSRQFQYEHTQSRIGKTLWEAPELYIANSPLFKADKVETPLLIMHNDKDGAVPWYQGIEYFLALRRLGKKVWMLQYNNEAHNLRERRNQKDLSIRMQQYFDYYLKGEPMPAWMKEGIKASEKGQQLKYETK